MSPQKPAWRGVDCSIKQCPNKCSGHGRCMPQGKCSCFGLKIFIKKIFKHILSMTFLLNPNLRWRQFDGFDCSKKKCIQKCNSHQFCNGKLGVCQCLRNWTGVKCSKPRCPKNCSGHGTCVGKTGKCSCDKHWVGPDCGKSICEKPCKNGGMLLIMIFFVKILCQSTVISFR